MLPHLRSWLATARLGVLVVCLACGAGCPGNSGRPMVAPVEDHASPPQPSGEPTSAPGAPADKPAAAQPAAPGEEKGRGPVFSLSVNRAASVDLFQGWPLLVQAELLHPRAFDAAPGVVPLRLAAPEGPWTNAVHLEVRIDGKEPAPWPFHLGTDPKGPLALDAQTAGAVVWWLSPEETARLPEGDYQVTGVLDTTAASAADVWKGTARSNTASVRVRKEPSPLSPSQQEDKFLLLADQDMFRGDAKQALARIEELLAKQPASIGGLGLKADVLAASGRTPEALQSYQEAITAFYKKYPKAPEGPEGLLTKYHALLNQALSGQR